MMTDRFTAEGWAAKAAAGVVLGFTLSVMFAGAVVVALGGRVAVSAPVQLAMWSVPLGWAAILGSCFLFRTGRQAWGWLALANLLAAALLLAVTGGWPA